MPASAAALATLHIEPETPFDRPAVEALVLRAFGPGRFAKTAERLRERSRLAAGFVARDGGQVVGSVRLWAITVADRPALFLGPIAVEADSRRGGLGADLTSACITHARKMGVSGVLLVGDPPYFTRFGFEAAQDVILPGPADPRRVMWLAIDGGVPQGFARALA